MNFFRNCRYDRIIPNRTRSFKIGMRNDLNKFRSPIIQRLYMGQTYEGTGRTTGHILNKKGAPSICIDGITKKGFKLTNGWTIIGPTIFFPHTIISWNIKDLNDISTDSLSLFSVLNPKVDMLILGVGSQKDLSFDKIKALIEICKGMKINFEIMSTENAAATFNFCSVDKRFVSAALIPPSKITYHHGTELIEASNLPDVKPSLTRTSS